MKFQYPLLVALTASLWPGLSSSSAHIGLGGRMFNNDSPIDGAAFSIVNQTVSSSYGWADGTDANWGDSHRLRFYKFTLTSTQTVDITVARRNDSGQTGAFDTLLPAFSLFTLSSAFVASTHDGSTPTTNYLTGLFGNAAIGETFVNTNGDVGYEAGDAFVDANSNSTWDVGEQFTDTDGDGIWQPGDSFTDTNGNGVQDGRGLGGSGKEGAFRALDTWKIHNDGGDEMHFSTLIGHAADGTAANYGSASGISGDGVADGIVIAKFLDLAPGEYYLAVGGADYLAQNTDPTGTGTSYKTYGVDVTVAAPEPTSAVLLSFGAAGLALTRRSRRRQSGTHGAGPRA